MGELAQLIALLKSVLIDIIWGGGGPEYNFCFVINIQQNLLL